MNFNNYPYLKFVCFGRGRDRQKRKRRNSLLKYGLIGAGALIGGATILAARRKGTPRPVFRETEQLVRDLGSTPPRSSVPSRPPTPRSGSKMLVDVIDDDRGVKTHVYKDKYGNEWIP